MTVCTGRHAGKIYLRIAIVLSFFLVGMASAAPPPEVVVQKMDSDGDGRISQSEWLKPPKLFKRIDANHDGYVVASEIAAFRGEKQVGNPAPEATPDAAPVSSSSDARPGDGWIDVHFHIVGNKDDLQGFDEAAQRALDIMKQNGMSRIVVMPPPRPHYNFDIESIAALSKKYGPRISVMAGGGSLNPMMQEYGNLEEVPGDVLKNFRAIAEDILAKGAKGFGEIGIHHVSLNPTHGYESVPADNPLMRVLAEVAGEHDVPIDMHFDPVPEDSKKPKWITSEKNPPVFKENITALDRLLDAYPKTRIIWAHAGSDPVGWYKPALVKKMLKKHPNLYFSIRAVAPPPREPVWNRKDGINHSWVKIFEKYPDRFVLGTDSFLVSDNYAGAARAPLIFQEKSAIQREGINELLRYLDKDVRRKIAYENAMRLYHLD